MIRKFQTKLLVVFFAAAVTLGALSILISAAPPVRSETQNEEHAEQTAAQIEEDSIAIPQKEPAEQAETEAPEEEPEKETEAPNVPFEKAFDHLAEMDSGAERTVPASLTLLDTFYATAYYTTGTTSTGTFTTEHRTLAVNPWIIPYGTHVWLYLDDGTLVGDFYAEDTGSNMMENPYVVDIYMGNNLSKCVAWGARHVSVYVTNN